jgi:hypothetical protein
MRDDIAWGRLSAKRYVTRYDFETREVTALVGQVPTARRPAAQPSASDSLLPRWYPAGESTQRTQAATPQQEEPDPRWKGIDSWPLGD